MNEKYVKNSKRQWQTLGAAAILAAAMMLAACSGTAAPTASTGPASTAVVMTDGPAVTAQATSQATGPAEDFETVAPELTPWPEPEAVDYSGKWLAVAQDKEPSKYPALKLAEKAIATTWGALRLPEGWTVRDADSFQPIITDSSNRAVGILEQIDSYPDEPWFSLLPEDAAAILWETPDYPVDARVLTMEDGDTDGDASRKTIRRQVTLIVGGPMIDDGGTASYQAISLILDKAYVHGDQVSYVLSNKVIDQIARSLAGSWQDR